MDLYVSLIEDPVALLHDLPDHVADHLLVAIGEGFLTKFFQQLLLDALNSGLSKLRSRLQTSYGFSTR